MTKGQIIARLRTILKEYSIDSQYSNRALWSIFYSKAKELIHRDADQKRKIYKSVDTWTTICIEMEFTSPILCEVIKIPLNSKIYRSKYKLPKMLESSTGPVIRMLASLDNTTTINFVTPLEFQVKTNLRWNKGYYAFFHNGYLWSNAHFGILMLSALFEEDTTMFVCGESNINYANNCKDCNKSSDPNTKTPRQNNKCGKELKANTGVSQHLENAAIMMALEELGITLSKPTDNHPNVSEIQKEFTP